MGMAMSNQLGQVFMWPLLSLFVSLALIACLFLFFLRWLRRDRALMRGYNKKLLLLRGSVKVCCICLEPLPRFSIVAVSFCHHIYHVRCLKQWLNVKRECPLCKSAMGTVMHISQWQGQSNLAQAGISQP